METQFNLSEYVRVDSEPMIPLSRVRVFIILLKGEIEKLEFKDIPGGNVNGLKVKTIINRLAGEKLI